MAFGKIIATARKTAGLSQKDLAERIRKDDGAPISPQYLNDIEHDRRNPPSGQLLDEFAAALGMDREYLMVMAGQVPEDLRDESAEPEQIVKAIRAFRQTLREG
jgi:transcriptional regulator with XRE-family HTH domain